LHNFTVLAAFSETGLKQYYFKVW